MISFPAKIPHSDTEAHPLNDAPLRTAGVPSRPKLLTLATLFAWFIIAACSETSTPGKTRAPQVPGGVKVMLLTPTAAIVTWLPNSESDGIVSYAVFRNGVRIGASSSTSFTDSGLVQLTVYGYGVAAVGSGGVSSPVSQVSPASTITAPDVTPPAVTAASPANRASDIAATATVRITFSEAVDAATLTDTTFTVTAFAPAGLVSVAGARTYDTATNTAIFTSALPYRNYASYRVAITTGVKDLAGNPVASQYTSCFTPTAGTGVATPLTGGHWSGNDACLEVHWHIPIVQTGNNLQRAADCGTSSVDCRITAVSESGRAILGGVTCRPADRPAPSLCDVQVSTLTGTAIGRLVSFSIITDNGLTYTFNGAFAESRTVNPYLTGIITGPTMPAVGINFEHQR